MVEERRGVEKEEEDYDVGRFSPLVTSLLGDWHVRWWREENRDVLGARH